MVKAAGCMFSSRVALSMLSVISDSSIMVFLKLLGFRVDAVHYNILLRWPIKYFMYAVEA